MASPARRPQAIRSNLLPHAPNRPEIRSLVVSSELEIRKPLLRTLDSLRIDVIVCNRLLEAEEALSKASFDMVFCDEHLPDGSYADLLHANHWDDRIPRIIVTTRHGDWDLYFEALAKGAFDVIRCPCYATDIEMTIIRALREGDALQGASS